MAAGESAYDVARRQREKAARLERSAELWERGAQGEVEVARALESLPEGWVVLHDLAWPGRPRANLDHVVIGPGGVFVVDAKNWSGRVEVRDQVLLQDGRRREPTVASAAEAAIAVQALLPVPNLCMGVLCFVRDEPLTGWARDVMVCSTANLVEMLTSRPRVLEAGDVERCVEAVRRATRRTSAPHRRSSLPAGSGSAARTPRRKGRRLITTVLAGVLFFGALTGGGLEKASDWVGEQMAEQMTPADPDLVEKPAPRKKKRQQQRQNG
ncbi:nuclease-related domain-containing protein [Nocardioides sediminis]|uniref:nuclease-related domain-containing protein n=1 Tax=Nocardioides sediminis TaxID=433648 RepID=UPI000D32638F|nr:nuclease-related domain-containing protein [Nocardioides sediminis]